VAAIVFAALAGAATAFLLARSASTRAARAVPTPTPAPPPLDVTPRELAGVWVGALGIDALVLTITARDASSDRVECALNAGTREVIAFEAVVERRRGLAERRLPGLDLRFGRAYEDAEGRLLIPLVDDDGRVRARLSKTTAPTEVVR
jgi:hypothetical protein